MQRVTKSFAAIAVSLIPVFAWSATVYVDDDNVAGPWNGTAEHPYRFIQEAIDNATSGDTIDVSEGLYLEQLLILDRTGLELRGAGAEQTVVDAQYVGDWNGLEHVVEIVRSEVEIHGFTIRHSRDEPGIYSGVNVEESTVHIHDNVITENRTGIRSAALGEQVPSNLTIERNRITRSSVFPAVIILNFTDQVQTGLIASNVITDNGSEGVQVSKAAIDIVGNTIADNGGSGIYTTPEAPHRIVDNILVNNDVGIWVLGGETTAIHLVYIAHNDVWNNSSGNYVEQWGWAEGGPFVPRPATGEIQEDPLFLDPTAGDYRVQLSSPCVDAGEPPQDFDGVPCFDVTGGVRLRDADGDGLAQHDMGAYELENPALQPGEVVNLGWESGSPDLLIWDSETSSESYEIYRGDLAAIGYQHWGTCLGTSGVPSFFDSERPQPGAGFFYLVTGNTSAEGAGTMGEATCAERSNYAPCP